MDRGDGAIKGNTYAEQSILLIFLTVVVMVGFILKLHPDPQIVNEEFSTTVNSSCRIKTIVLVTELQRYHNSYS